MTIAASVEEYSKARLRRVVSRLKAHGYRMTPQRAAVVRELVTSTEHPSAQSLYERLAQQFPMMSLATVYKTIALLKELGEVIELPVECDGMHFDGRRPDAHPHVICTHCGRIVDIEVDEIEALTRRVASQAGFASVSHRLDFWGVCARCQAEE